VQWPQLVDGRLIFRGGGGRGGDWLGAHLYLCEHVGAVSRVFLARRVIQRATDGLAQWLVNAGVAAPAAALGDHRDRRR
jgi:hypothetical protein